MGREQEDQSHASVEAEGPPTTMTAATPRLRKLPMPWPIFRNELLPDLVPGSTKTKRLTDWTQLLPELLRIIDSVYILEERNPTLSQSLAMTVGTNNTAVKSIVARQIRIPSSPGNRIESDFIKDLAKHLGTSEGEANRFLGEMGIATHFDEKTGYHILAFIQEPGNKKSPCLGRNGTTTARMVIMQDIATGTSSWNTSRCRQKKRGLHVARTRRDPYPPLFSLSN